MKNETKLKKLIQWLEENKIQYVLPTRKQKGSSDLFIVEYLISVKIESDDDKLFFNNISEVGILSLYEVQKHLNSLLKRCRI